ncbi:hypothetical protein BGZ82_010392 [Podila clonocystis]|nr:hypothetical protein BGZ82_010392 [Podila clonocystis]
MERIKTPEDDVDPSHLKQYPAFVVRLQEISCDFTHHCQTRFPSAFAPLALFVHYLFKEEVILLLAPCSAWLIDYTYALHLILAVTLSEMINGLIKWYFRYPRPCFIDPRIRNIRGAWEEDYGFPSSHTMLMVCVATVHMIHYVTKDQSTITLVCIPVFWGFVLLTSFTRMYLGLHFLHDVAAAILVAPFVAWAAYALNMWLGGQALVTRVLAGVLLPVTCLLVAMVIRENLPAESLVQRQIWGDRAMEGYLRSRQATGAKKEESPDLLEKSVEDETLHSSHVDGITGDQTLCILPGAPTVPTHSRTYILESAEHVISVEPSEDGPGRVSRSNMSGVGTVYITIPVMMLNKVKHPTKNCVSIHDAWAGTSSLTPAAVRPSYPKHYSTHFHTCPVAFSKRRFIYWGFGFGLLVPKMLVLAGVVEPMLKKRFPGNRWLNGAFRGMMAAWVVLWTGWLSWQALFTFWPGLQACA